MATSQSTTLEAYCDAKKRRGGRCRLPAGWATPHEGRGPCKFHGGRLPNVVQHYAQEQAMDEAKKWGVGADVDPLQAILETVRLSAGAHREFQRRVAEKAGAEPNSPEVMAYMAAVKQTAQIAKMALDAGVAERLVNLAEREGEMLAALFEDVLAEVELTPAQRTALAAGLGRKLALLEGGDVIEGTEVA
jgi:hypothetical protein